MIGGNLGDWAELGEPAGRLRLVAGPRTPAPGRVRLDSDQAALDVVARDPTALAVVPASAVGPGVRVLTVDGVDPIADPSEYPLGVPGPAPGRVVSVTVVGDVMLARGVHDVMAAAGDFAAPLRPTARRLAAADLTLGNLESSLSQLGPPRQGDDSFGAVPQVRSGLRLAGFDVLSLANNHVGDYGPRSLVETVRLVRRAGITPVGAGANARVARAPAVVERGGVRFGVLAFNAIGESPAAGADRPGTVRLAMRPRLGPLDQGQLDRLERAIRALRSRVDVVMVLPHWGEQYTNVPVPDQRTVARALVDAGADLVVGGHPHWVQGAELHRGRLIAYSLGNYVFDMDFSRETQEGVALEVLLWDDQVKAAEFVPVVIGADFAPRVVGGPRADAILERMWAASGPPFSAGSRS